MQEKQRDKCTENPMEHSFIFQKVYITQLKADCSLGSTGSLAIVISPGDLSVRR